jgi:ribosomal protein S18 acetylase RimI-like enzyme
MPHMSGVRRLGRHSVDASLHKPKSAAEWREARRLVEEYAASLNLDLSFQNFAQELEHFESEYSPPTGAFVLVREKGSFVGCVGLRKLSDTVGEIKRLYVEPTARGLGLGEALVRGIVDEGKKLGYARLVLDTLPSMLEARSLYHALGFTPVAPYRYNPVAETAFLELRLHDQGGV